MFNLWKPLIPPGVEGTWAPVKEAGRMAWYFNGYYPWLGMLFCAPIIGLWYWCTDQYIVQRALGAPNQQTARRGSIFAAVLKLSPVYLFIIRDDLLGARQERQGGRARADRGTGWSAHRAPGQAAFPLMVKYLLPAGLRGIVVAALLSALMGFAGRVFNA